MYYLISYLIVLLYSEPQWHLKINANYQFTLFQLANYPLPPHRGLVPGWGGRVGGGWLALYNT